MNQTKQLSDVIKPGNKLLGSFIQSTTIWLLLLLIAFDFFLATVHPLKYITTARYIPLDQNPVVSKIPVFFSNPEKPDVLLLGSSLLMAAVVKYDAVLTGQSNITELQEMRRYTRAIYLQKLLDQKQHQNINIFNLTCPACMVSDATLILQKAINANKTPKVVIYGLAPRDFIDNQVPQIGKTPVYEVLADWTSFSDLLRTKSSITDVRDFFISSAWYYYKVKADYRTLLITLASDITKRPANLFQAAQSASINQSGTNNSNFKSTSTCLDNGKVSALDLDLTTYKHRYSPPNFARFQQELTCYKTILQLCKKNHIHLVIVNMPIRKENRDLISDRLYQLYIHQVSTLPSQYGQQFIDLDHTALFIPTDFSDSVHTNALGGKKVQDQISKYIDWRNI